MELLNLLKVVRWDMFGVILILMKMERFRYYFYKMNTFDKIKNWTHARSYNILTGIDF